MGRRSSVVKMTPEEMLGRLRERISRYNMLPGVNKAQFEAQRLEVEMVGLIRDIAYESDTPPSLRLEAAKYIITLARGPIAPWSNKGLTIDPDDKGTVLDSVGDELRASTDMTALYGEMDDLVRSRVPFTQWPDRVKQLAEAAAFSDTEEPLPEITADPPAGKG